MTCNVKVLLGIFKIYIFYMAIYYRFVLLVFLESFPIAIILLFKLEFHRVLSLLHLFMLVGCLVVLKLFAN